MKKTAKILVIEDDADIARMIQMLLTYKGYAVTVSDRTEQSDEMLRNSNIDVVIMDMFLSGVNGIDICIRFKSDNRIAHIPVIMMSAHPDAKKICLEAGADDFISKPFDMKDLLSMVSVLIKKNRVTQ